MLYLWLCWVMLCKHSGEGIGSYMSNNANILDKIMTEAVAVFFANLLFQSCCHTGIFTYSLASAGNVDLKLGLVVTCAASAWTATLLNCTCAWTFTNSGSASVRLTNTDWVMHIPQTVSHVGCPNTLYNSNYTVMLKGLDKSHFPIQSPFSSIHAIKHVVQQTGWN